jgi:hypothetical protein
MSSRGRIEAVGSADWRNTLTIGRVIDFPSLGLARLANQSDHGHARLGESSTSAAGFVIHPPFPTAGA